jgi:hypothetical protein
MNHPFYQTKPNVIPNPFMGEGSVKIGNFLNFDFCSLIFDMILYKRTQF